MSRRLQFYHFALMPYPYVPAGDQVEASWVTLSNSYYDPRKGHELYTRYINEAVLAEGLGYDGTCVNEHHQTAYGTMPDPNVMASQIVARTKKIIIGIIGNALPLHENPLRVAESVAMLDVISGGRIISGFVRGTGMEYHSLRANPSYSQDRFWEAHDLIVAAWTRRGPFAWNGRFFDIPYVNPWPKPFQSPHPPIWLPGTGSLETIDKAAKHRYPFMMVFAPLWFTKSACDMYRRIAGEKYGYEVKKEQLGFCVPTYVAESDEKAHAEAKEHFMWLFRTGLKIPTYQNFPPGYVSPQSYGNMLKARVRHKMKRLWQLSYEELLEEQYIIVGSAATVVEKLSRYTDEIGAGLHVASSMQVGDMPHWKVVKNMTLFASEVMPHFRDKGIGPIWQEGEPIPGSSQFAENQPRPVISADRASTPGAAVAS